MSGNSVTTKIPLGKKKNKKLEKAVLGEGEDAEGVGCG